MKRFFAAATVLLCAFTLLSAEGSDASSSDSGKEKEKKEEKKDIDGNRVYLKLGGALLFDERRVVPEPTFGFGYRYEEGMFAADLSFFNESIGPTVNYKDYGKEVAYERNKMRITLTRWVNLSFFWLAEPASWHSFYAGGGFAVETLDLELLDDISSQTGIAATATVGWEFLRDRMIMVFAQIEAVLPCYAGHFEGDTFWIPSLTLTVGAGF